MVRVVLKAVSILVREMHIMILTTSRIMSKAILAGFLV